MAAHRRHGLASETIEWTCFILGFRTKAVIDTAKASGSAMHITIAARHIAIAKQADGFALALCCVLAFFVIWFIAATNGRIPRMNGEYKLTSDDTHCQYCRL